MDDRPVGAIMIRLRLYVTGRTVSAERARLALRDLERRLAHTTGESTIHCEVIDVLDDPEAAERDKIFATPTLLRLGPGTQPRVFGDFIAIDKVISALKLDAKPVTLAATA
jgi:circadian clock protein KaiB